MRAHVTNQSGLILNTIMVHQLGALMYDADLVGGSSGDSIVGGELVKATPPVAVPESVSPRQIRQAMTRVGLRTMVEAAIAAADIDTKDWYEFATEFDRHNSHVITLATALNVPNDQLDQLWILASTL